MKKRILICTIIYCFFISFSVNATEFRVGSEFSFEKPVLILGLQGELGEGYKYEITKNFLGNKKMELFFGKWFGKIGGEFDKLFSDELVLRWRLRLESGLLEKYLIGQREDLYTDLILDYDILSNKRKLNMNYVYEPKNKNYYLVYKFIISE